MTGLPAKYARMGFKRGWAAYRGTRRISTKTSRSVTRMGKRRGGFRRGGSNNLMKSVLIGAGVAYVGQKFGLSPIITAGAGYFVGGVPVAAGAFIAPMILNNGTLGNQSVTKVYS